MQCRFSLEYNVSKINKYLSIIVVFEVDALLLNGKQSAHVSQTSMAGLNLHPGCFMSYSTFSALVDWEVAQKKTLFILSLLLIMMYYLSDTFLLFFPFNPFRTRQSLLSLSPTPEVACSGPGTVSELEQIITHKRVCYFH